jgi:hypothetical protein
VFFNIADFEAETRPLWRKVVASMTSKVATEAI